MKTLQLTEIIEVIQGKIVKGSADVKIKHVTKRAKHIKDHSLYFHVTGKQMMANSLTNKRNYIIVTDNLSLINELDLSATLVLIDDINVAFWQFVSYYRNLFDIPIIGITGTCGKTTTKDMITHILKKDTNVHSTQYSQNGMHLNLHYLMGLNEKTDVAVFEMGVAYPGNIRNSGKYFRPTIGIITNIGEAHLDGCKTLAKYIEAKGEMLQVLSQHGNLIINQDDINIKKIDFRYFSGTLTTFGIEQPADYQATNLTNVNKGIEYRLHALDKVYQVYLPVFGKHNIYNSLAAIAACHLIGVPIESAIKRLKTYALMQRHTKVFKGWNGCQMIDDTWSCNPSSVQSGLEVLKTIAKGKKTVLVLGEMQRLGKSLQDQHRKLANTISEKGHLDTLITIGTAAHLTSKTAVTLGMNQANVYEINNADELDKILLKICNSDSVVLFKLSLGKMETSYKEVLKKWLQYKPVKR